uniref:Rqc2 homolog RqcH n=1 Tax=uncultured bacterium Contig87 TaxID=1393621 RepID=W0FQS0_9BACT|nr:fibronectin-binding A domain-containing protein [uncultured bacterium Contig87]
MPMDGLTVGFAARELDRTLRGGRVDRIAQPERDTVVMVIRAGSANHKLLLCASPNNARLHLTTGSFSNPLEPPSLCMLLRKQLTGARVEEIRQVGGDRIVYLDFDTVNELGDRVPRRLVLEIMGRHSNLVLLDENGKILEATRHVNMEMSRVRQIQPGMTYAPPPPQDRLGPDDWSAEKLYARLSALPEGRLEKALGDSITGLSRVSAEELACRLLQSGEDWPADLREACGRLESLLARLPEMADPRVLRGEEGEAEDVFAFPYFSRRTDRQETFRTLSEALEVYFGTRDAKERLNQRSTAMLHTLKVQLERCQRKLALQEEELASAERMEEYRRMGEAINGSLYMLKKGMSEAALPDWSDPDGGTINVPLDIRLTPGQNAQKYFKKYQKARSARETAAQQREKTLAETDYLEGMLLDIGKCTGESELEEIRQELVRAGYLKKITNRRQQRQLPQSKPYRYISSDGIEILVGKNAAQNDRLTLGAKPEEMWLHAKDMPGSHVIIRREGEIPQETLKEAALLAAWYSKGQRSSLVPIDYTLRKYVKKPSGAAPGKVIYTHHKTAYITAEEQEIKKIRLEEA